MHKCIFLSLGILKIYFCNFCVNNWREVGRLRLVMAGCVSSVGVSGEPRVDFVSVQCPGGSHTGNMSTLTASLYQWFQYRHKFIIRMKFTVLFNTLISLTRTLNLGERISLAPSVRFNPEDEHRQLLENVIEFGLNRSSHLVQVQEKELYDKGMVLSKSQPGHFVSVFNKQDKKSKRMSTFAYATLQASSLLSKQSVCSHDGINF